MVEAEGVYWSIHKIGGDYYQGEIADRPPWIGQHKTSPAIALHVALQRFLSYGAAIASIAEPDAATRSKAQRRDRP